MGSVPEGIRLTVRGQADPTRVGTRRSPRLLHRHHRERVRALRTLAIGATAPTTFEQPGRFVHFEDVTRDGRYVVFKSLKAFDEIWIQRVGSAERRALLEPTRDVTAAAPVAEEPEPSGSADTEDPDEEDGEPGPA